MLVIEIRYSTTGVGVLERTLQFETSVNVRRIPVSLINKEKRVNALILYSSN